MVGINRSWIYCQNDPVFHFPPALPTIVAAPNPPSQPYQFNPGPGKFSKEVLVREFVAIATKIHDLEHNLRLAQEGNQKLKYELTQFQAQTERRIEEISKGFDGKIAAIKVEQSQHAKRLEEQKLAADTDEDDNDSSDDSVMVVDEATEKAEESVEAARSTKVKVC